MGTSSEDIRAVEKLESSENFSMWKFQTAILFKSDGLYDLVMGIEIPKDGADSKFALRDARAQKIIVSTIAQKHLMHILTCTTAHDMYKKLSSIFERDTELQKFCLLQEFFELKYEEGMDIASHISKIENLAFRLKSLDHQVDTITVLSKVLTTLPTKFSAFLSAWDSTPSADKTLESLTSRLIAEEKRLQKSDDVNHQVAFKTYSKTVQPTSMSEITCFRCKMKGHYAKFCPKVESKKCKICKKSNHVEKDCYFRKNMSKKSKPANAQLSFLTHASVKSSWIVDSGSTSHMTNDETLMSEKHNIVREIGLAKKSSGMTACKIGTVETTECKLKNVLYVPELTTNLLSVDAVIQNGGTVCFSENQVVISKDEAVLKGYRCENGLYTVKMEQGEQQCALSAESTSENRIMKWHRRLGHISKTGMKELIEISVGTDLTKEDIESLQESCEICLKAKQTRLPFNTDRTRATRPLEVIHTDVCGPITKTWDNKRYILTFLDDYTHFSMIYLLESKADVSEAVIEYIKEVERKWDSYVYKIRCDNGGEYMNWRLKNWCKSRGIVLDTCPPHTPQHNGKAERLNRTLLERTRALMFDSQCDETLWGEAARTAAYLINRSPTANEVKTPAELWYKKPPNISHLRVFGSVAYAKVTRPCKKLEERSKKYIMVGYTTGAYRLWDEERRKIVVSRDVAFSENKPAAKQKEEFPFVFEGPTNDISCEEPGVTQENEEVTTTTPEVDEENESYEDENTHDEVAERRRRAIKLPKRFEDYVMLSFEEAVNGPDSEKWKKAIDEEKKSLLENETWEVINKEQVPEGKKILTSMWVFKQKDDGQFKARLVVKGCQQKEGMDYVETYSPVLNNSSLKMLLALAEAKNYHIMTFDIKTAFLYGKLNDEAYMYLPEGMEEENKVCKLEKALYGMKQAPLRWNQHVTTSLKSKGLLPLRCEPCIFKNKENSLYLGIYVDDGLLIGETKTVLKDLLLKLEEEFQIKIQEDPKSFVGMQLERTEHDLVLKQTSFVENLLENYNMQDAKPSSTPVECGSPVNCSSSPENQNFPYRQLVGSLLYLSKKTRPDISFGVNLCSRHMENPNRNDIENSKRILRYLKGTKDQGLHYCSGEVILTAYCDADYAGDAETRKSTSGFIIYFCGCPVSWATRKQPIVALSTTEAEYIAAAECAKELLYLKSVAEELLELTLKPKLFVDNQSAIMLMKNGIFNRRSKHIDVRYHFLNEKVNEGLFEILYCPTNEQIADVFTKALKGVKFKELVSKFVS